MLDRASAALQREISYLTAFIWTDIVKIILQIKTFYI